MPPSGGLPNPGIKGVSPVPPAWAGQFFTASTTWEAPSFHRFNLNSPFLLAFPDPFLPALALSPHSHLSEP